MQIFVHLFIYRLSIRLFVHLPVHQRICAFPNLLIPICSGLIQPNLIHLPTCLSISLS